MMNAKTILQTLYPADIAFGLSLLTIASVDAGSWIDFEIMHGFGSAPPRECIPKAALANH
ncbi:MAG: hypothetical protein M2R45_04638 [Verrucomicrobia subdivision 3 bacterium]|nr:hypothetical protein [Limisphaerales bacterium]MCS1417130.1 hypothetical protein [Limisphaerales bacterium]